MNMADDHRLSSAEARAFADDIVIIIEGIKYLKKVWTCANQWSLRNDIEINREKSGYFEVKVD
jgi:hypothetical protein